MIPSNYEESTPQGDARLDQLAAMVKALSEKFDAMQSETKALREELAENTEITKQLRDVGTFVRVGTKVLKWLGVIAIAIGSLVAGWKMTMSGHTPMQIGPHPGPGP